MPINIQQFSVFKYVRFYLSPFLRKPKLLAYLNALLTPLQAYRDNLVSTVYPTQERQARFNAQVIRFEKILNSLFNSTLIYIDEAGNHDRTYVFNQIELQPLYLSTSAENSPIYLFNRKEYFGLYDFTVHVPQNLYDTSLAPLRVAIERYKLAGTSYQIRPI